MLFCSLQCFSKVFTSLSSQPLHCCWYRRLSSRSSFSRTRRALLDFVERLERVDWADLVLWQREDALFRRFWEMDRCRFFIEEEAAMLTIQGCLSAWPAVRRSFGSTVRTRSMKSLARLETLGHGCQETEKKSKMA